jgi:hypothetical protein
MLSLSINAMQMNEWYDTETMDHLLSRDWFVDDDSICEVLLHADQEAWKWILLHRNKFSSRIQKNIAFVSSYFSPVELQKVTVQEISDAEWTNIHTKHIRDMEAEFTSLWKDYLQTVPSRPKTNIDAHFDQVSLKLAHEHEVLLQHTDMQKKKYLTPAARLKHVDTRLQQIQATIRSLQQELEKTQTHIDQLEEAFQKNKKREFRFMWLTS